MKPRPLPFWRVLGFYRATTYAIRHAHGMGLEPEGDIMIEHPSGYGYVPKHAPPAGDGRPLPAERVIVAAPTSFAGSAERIWLLTRYGPAGGGWGASAVRVLLCAGLVLAVALAWVIVVCRYAIFGLLVPYRATRRALTERRREELRYRELLAAIEAQLRQPWPGR